MLSTIHRKLHVSMLNASGEEVKRLVEATTSIVRTLQQACSNPAMGPSNPALVAVLIKS